MIQQPLVSVIIPCYNHGRFIEEAIRSVLLQSYKNVEIVIVDDGSIDDTKAVIDQYAALTYVYQPNQGPSAARNTGIKHSKGEVLVFLDADDWLLKDAFSINLGYLERNPAVAFVSGAHEIFQESENINCLVQQVIVMDPYCHLLAGNYIGMHAAVMYKRWIFNELEFDTSLRFCEDYDMYLKIARQFEVIHHVTPIAAYRIHPTNVSGNFTRMLHFALLVLNRQRPFLSNPLEEKYFQAGSKNWITFYTEKIYDKLSTITSWKELKLNEFESKTLKHHNPYLYMKFSRKKIVLFLKKFVPGFLLKVLRKTLNRQSAPGVGKVNFGDFNRPHPFSTKFGYDRGGPIDRHYIENFLKGNYMLIKGRVLEIGDNEYTLSYGASRVTQSDILHIDDNNKKATFVGDLSNAPHLPSEAFDCIILTQTLHLIYNCKSAVETCYRILKPGGALLITVPGISHIAHDQWGKNWFWSFTSHSLKNTLQEYFPPDNTQIEAYGNSLVAIAFLYGLGLPEINKKYRDHRDPYYQLIITSVSTKPKEN